ncbi:hypothetical protein DBR42_01505 [Pelomonas sp. HMWF004]|nr:hypothetical protein DBR42_01505 [Pelomonas sp. HMWF004]
MVVCRRAERTPARWQPACAGPHRLRGQRVLALLRHAAPPEGRCKRTRRAALRTQRIAVPPRARRQ